VLPFISLYNGERGSKAPFFKYLFYGFYPLHLWLIALIANYVH
ncbi:MAG: TraX family protein, partial [Enterococcus faecalis]|nr:TraX family protein [Enterococcus faecalis]